MSREVQQRGFYTRYPRDGERPAADAHFYQQVYFHRLGAPDSEDVYSIGKDFPKIAEVQLESNADSDYIVATVANGDGGDYEPDVIVPESETVVKGVVATTNELLIQTMEGGPSGLYAYGLDSSNRKTVPIPNLTDVFSFFAYELGKASAPPVNSVAGTGS